MEVKITIKNLIIELKNTRFENNKILVMQDVVKCRKYKK